eukprot:752113-Pleurochrysis_carterae.AAC.1
MGSGTCGYLPLRQGTTAPTCPVTWAPWRNFMRVRWGTGGRRRVDTSKRCHRLLIDNWLLLTLDSDAAGAQLLEAFRCAAPMLSNELIRFWLGFKSSLLTTTFKSSILAKKPAPEGRPRAIRSITRAR